MKSKSPPFISVPHDSGLLCRMDFLKPAFCNPTHFWHKQVLFLIACLVLFSETKRVVNIVALNDLYKKINPTSNMSLLQLFRCQKKISGLNRLINKQIHRHQAIKSNKKSPTPLSRRLCDTPSKLQTCRLPFIKTEWE